MRIRLTLAIAATALTLPVAAHARQPVSLSANVFLEKVDSDRSGHERRVLAVPGALEQGDRLVFLLRYRNDGGTPVSDFAVTNPVPASIRVDATDPAMLVSVDGGRNWGRLDQLEVRTPLGGIRRAVADDITHVRWTVRASVAPGDGGQIAYRGTVR